MSVCKGCGREIKWIKTVSGKAMPCDPEIVIFRKGGSGKDKIVTADGFVVSGNIVKDSKAGDSFGLVPHWATCPAQERFRERGKQHERIKS